MPRTYRPRPYIERTCVRCGFVFQTNHSRTRYCSDSCRVNAFYARQQGTGTLGVAEAAQPIAPDLSFSLQNVGVSAAGAGAAALFNYAFNDHPSQQEVIRLLKSIKQDQPKVDFPKLAMDLTYLVAYVEAQVEVDPALGARMLKRVKEQTKKNKLKKEEALKKLLGGISPKPRN